MLQLIILIALLISHADYQHADIPVSVNETCVSCHSTLLENPVLHPQIESTCDVCHVSNGEVHPDNNKKGFTLTDEMPALCFICHTDLEEHYSADSSVHKADTGSSACIACHDPHSSPFPRLVKRGGNELCLGCHNRTIVTDSVKIRNISQVLLKAKSVHPAIESGGCVLCHNPHSSEYRSLLVGSFPAEDYVKASAEIFGICFMCHDVDLLEAPETEYGTNFRNGTRNLHYIHCNGDRGRNCILCHDVHAGENERMIAGSVKYGNWEFKIDYQTSETGGSCLTACHVRKDYDRTVSE